eukprot:498986-Prorocentrum_minimum.AAC.1
MTNIGRRLANRDGREVGDAAAGTSPTSPLNVLPPPFQVNDPLRWEGVTMYQTDWSLSSLVINAKGSSVRRAPHPRSRAENE